MAFFSPNIDSLEVKHCNSDYLMLIIKLNEIMWFGAYEGFLSRTSIDKKCVLGTGQTVPFKKVKN